MTRAEEAALKVYPVKNKYYTETMYVPTSRDDGIEYDVRKVEDTNLESRKRFIEGYETAEKDMKERFIRFVHRHYPINYTGWIQDFQKAMED